MQECSGPISPPTPEISRLSYDVSWTDTIIIDFGDWEYDRSLCSNEIEYALYQGTNFEPNTLSFIWIDER